MNKITLTTNDELGDRQRILISLHTSTFRSLEIVLPLMEHPSEEFLASVEEDLITLIMKCGQLIVQVCDKILSCLLLLEYTMNRDSSP